MNLRIREVTNSLKSINVKVEEMSIILSQENDCCDMSNDSRQSLTIKTENGGGGPFVTLETTRWAIDTDELDVYTDLFKLLVETTNEEQ